MKWFLYAISLICIAFGCWVILYTKETRNFVKIVFYKVDRKILSVFEAIMGILLLFSATATHHPWIIRLIGLLAIIEAGVIFLISKNLNDELINWYVNLASDNIYRLFGIISLVFGTLFLSWILQIQRSPTTALAKIQIVESVQNQTGFTEKRPSKIVVIAA